MAYLIQFGGIIHRIARTKTEARRYAGLVARTYINKPVDVLIGDEDGESYTDWVMRIVARKWNCLDGKTTYEYYCAEDTILSHPPSDGPLIGKFDKFYIFDVKTGKILRSPWTKSQIADMIRYR